MVKRNEELRRKRIISFKYQGPTTKPSLDDNTMPVGTPDEVISALKDTKQGNAS